MELYLITTAPGMELYLITTAPEMELYLIIKGLIPSAISEWVKAIAPSTSY